MTGTITPQRIPSVFHPQKSSVSEESAMITAYPYTPKSPSANATTSPNAPSISTKIVLFGVILLNAPTGPQPVALPSESSQIMTGSPTIMTQSRYISTNAPPPFIPVI